MKARLTGAALGFGMLGVILLSGPARAQDGGTDGGNATPNCNDTTMFPNPIYFGGSSAFTPVVQRMAAALSSRTVSDGDGGTVPAPITLLYVTGLASCDGASYVKSGTKASGTASYFPNPTGTAPTCNIPANTTLDIGVSDVFFETCGLGARPTTIGDFRGPVQPMILIVPSAASPLPLNITAAEAADVWGCGATGMVQPWVVESAIQQRSFTSGTQNIIARSINVLASSFHGTSNSSGGNLVKSLLGQSNISAAIGFLGAADFANDRSMGGGLTPLAFQGLEQTEAYYADSDISTTDKRNVRDGHYLPWGYEHLFTAVDTTGAPTDAKAKMAIDWILNNTTTAANAPNFDPVQLETASSVVPLCAMKVQRASDGGFLSPYAPANGDTCSCFFEYASAGNVAPSGCLACTSDSTCTGGLKCHHGFCE